MSSIIRVSVPTTDRAIEAIEIDGEPWICLKPACESLGIDYSTQRKRLEQAEWSTVGLSPTVAEDGKNREMLVINRKTFVMWLATINPARVNSTSAPIIVAFQKEASEALDAYFFGGVAVNPAATEEQLDHAHQVIELMKEAHEPVLAGTSAGSRYMTIYQYERNLGTSFTNAQRKAIRKKAWKICGESDLHPRQVMDPDRGKCFSLPEQMWHEASFVALA